MSKKIRSYSHSLGLIPKQYTNIKSLNGIYSEIDDIVLHFQMHGCIFLLPYLSSNARRALFLLIYCPHSRRKMGSLSRDFAQEEHASLNQHLRKGHDSYCHVSATSSCDHCSLILPDIVAKQWGRREDITSDNSMRILAAYYTSCLKASNCQTHLRYRTRQTHLRYHTLRTDVYSNTIFQKPSLFMAINVRRNL
jgi:hypothetical protein